MRDYFRPIFPRSRMSSNPDSSSSASPEQNLPRPLAADELLPPVEPPSASFILQLFVVPALIVLVVVLLGWLVTLLATSAQDPHEIVANLRSSSQLRWQQASDLGDMLRNDKAYPEIRQDEQLAVELAKLLQEEVKAGKDDPDAITMRTFLCWALRSFAMTEGVDALVLAARDDKDPSVRGEAIKALAVLADDLRLQESEELIFNDDLVDTFIALANDKNDLIRTETAFALGTLVQLPDADPRLTDELVKLVDDLYPYARYNAALALARQGNMVVVPAVAEMLDLESLSVSVKTDEDETFQKFNRNTILKNGLQATENLHQKSPQADLSELRAAIEKLITDGPTWEKQGAVPEKLLEQAQEVLAGLE
jgi:hypothetical protein